MKYISQAFIPGLIAAAFILCSCPGPEGPKEPDATQVAALAISPAAGVYKSARTVSISCSTPDAQIRYTTNGDDPAPDAGTIFDADFTVSSDCVIKAIAYKTGMTDSSIASSEYRFTPAAPAAPAASAGLHQATVTWDAAAGLTYNLYWSRGSSVSVPDGTKIAGATSPCTIAGIAGARTHSFILTAVNANGESEASPIAAAAPTGAWAAKGGAGFTSARADYVSLALDPAGMPYIAYADSANSGYVTVMRYSGSGWSLVGDRGFSGVKAAYVSIAIDSNGVPYVAYKNDAASTTKKAMVRRYNSATAKWDLAGNHGTDGISSGEVSDLSIAIDGNGVPYIAYVNYAVYELVVKKLVGASWTDVGAQPMTGYGTNYPSLAIGPDGAPYVAYNFGTDDKARVRKFNSATASWDLVGADGFSEGATAFISMKVGRDGAPYVLYADTADGGSATVMRYSGYAWESVGAPGFSNGTAYYSALALDIDGTPYAASFIGKVGLMRNEGTGWESVGAAEGFSAGEAEYLSIALDASGTPFVAYSDAAASGKATVMSF